MSKMNGLCMLNRLKQLTQVFVNFFSRGPLAFIVPTLIVQEPAFKKHLMTFDGDTQGADGHVFRGVASGKAGHVLQCAVEQMFGVPVIQFTEDVAKAVSKCQSREQMAKVNSTRMPPSTSGDDNFKQQL